jgi:hypothetical protein
MISARFLRLLFFSCATALFAWACFDARFRDVEGFLSGRFCLPISAAVSLLVLGWAAHGPCKKFAFWFALAIIGQAVALQMIDAGQAVRYQHYKPLRLLLTTAHLPLLLFFVAQTALVLKGLRPHWSTMRAWVKQTFKRWQLVGIGLVFILSSAAVSREVPSYLAELPFAAFMQLVNLVTVVLMMLALPEEVLTSVRSKVKRMFGQREEQQARPPIVSRFAILAAAWVLLFTASLSFFIYERHPHVQDEVVYLYQARYLANAEVTAPAAPVAEAFSIYMIPYKSARWYSPFPPGWPALLAVGILLGAPWLVNPVLAGVNILLTYILVQELYSRRTAHIAVLLLCISPWQIFMGMGFMSHPFTLTCALLAAVAMVRARKTGRAGWGWLSGFAAGVVGLIRPLDGFAIAGLLGLWAIGIGGRRLRAASILGFVLGAVLMNATVLPYNKLLTGDPTLSPLMDYYDKYFGPNTNSLGFGPGRGLGWALDPFPGHSPFEALINANLNTFSLNIELFGWGIGSLLLVALILFSGSLRKSDYLMLAVIITVFGLYSLYWFSGGPDFGARYWYLMLVPLVILATRAVEFLEHAIERPSRRVTAKPGLVMATVLSLCFFTLVNYFPWRALDKYHHYLGMRPGIENLAKEHRFGKSLVLIRGDSHPDYESAWVYNPLDFSADAPVYAWDLSPEIRQQVLNAFPDRPVWVVEGPTLTQGSYQVVQGPLSAQEIATKKDY